MKKQEILDAFRDFVMPTYKRLPVIFTKAKGMKVWDVDCRQYLDFFPGWGVSGLGHCHPAVQAAVRHQVSRLIHMPNNYYSIPQAKLAKELIYWSFPGKVFFCNSGAEANEAAIKLARYYGKGRYEIIVMKNAFHGRTLGALAATAQAKYQDGFQPLPQGFKVVDFNDLDQLKKAVSPLTVAIMLELIQGEGGIHVAREEFVKGLESLCRQKDLLLIVDEVQTGIGRTGKMFCYQHYDIQPDIITLAKALGGGLPIGAMIAHQRIADTLTPGTHASTFGGSALVCKASLAVLATMQREKLTTNAQRMGNYLFQKLREVQHRYPMIKEVRGKGLMVGIELDRSGDPVVDSARAKGLLINCTHQCVLRLMPALNVTKVQVNQALKILEACFKELT